MSGTKGQPPVMTVLSASGSTFFLYPDSGYFVFDIILSRPEKKKIMEGIFFSGSEFHAVSAHGDMELHIMNHGKIITLFVKLPSSFERLCFRSQGYGQKRKEAGETIAGRERNEI